MLYPFALSPNLSKQHRRGFIASILLIVFLVHAVLVGFIWKHQSQEPKAKIHLMPQVSFFEFVMPENENKEALTAQSVTTSPKTENLKETTPESFESHEIQKITQALKPVSLKPLPGQTVPQTDKNQSSANHKKTAESNADNEIPPNSSASYLNNPHPTYPRKSRHLNEQGRVVLAVEVNIEGTVSAIKISQTSGYPRLDRSAIEAVHTWRFIAGKKSGVAQKMWVNIPINFVLE